MPTTFDLATEIAASTRYSGGYKFPGTLWGVQDQNGGLDRVRFQSIQHSTKEYDANPQLRLMAEHNMRALDALPIGALVEKHIAIGGPQSGATYRKMSDAAWLLVDEWSDEDDE